MRKSVLAVTAILTGLGLATAHAQSDQAPAASAPQARPDVPTRGLTMAQVEKRFGAPSDKLAAIGKPPITRWVYPNCVVYFEYNLVLHSVATQPAPASN